MTTTGIAAARKPPSDPSPRYLHEHPIEHATIKEVAPGVHWVRMPLPMAALEHINLWVLDDGDDFVMVDTGFAAEDTRENWNIIFDGPLAGRRANRLICTHFHNDHASTAGWLIQRMGCSLHMTQPEFLTGITSYGDQALSRREDAMELLLHNGLDPRIAAGTLDFKARYGAEVKDFPRSFQRIQGGQEIAIGGRQWKVILGYGHSPEHAALYCADLGVLIAGDMVLPRITTNVSVQAVEPDANPLRWFMDSLAVHATLPADTLVLPSHGLPFHGLRERVRYLRNHHKQRLEELVQACATPKSAADVLPLLFRRKLDERETRIAMGEALAHMHELYYDGRLRRYRDEQGVWRYTKT